MKIYEVGGCVRDELLGIESKDIDFSVVLGQGDLDAWKTKKGVPHEPFEIMKLELQRRGYRIFKSDGPFFTVRARFPEANGHPALIKHGKAGLTADFVLARKEGKYTDGRRPDEVVPGTLEDDLARRDFRMNAIAKDEEGNLIDPFGGLEDIELRIIRTVGDPMDRFTEDALRAVRALRFSVTKGFLILPSVADAMESLTVLDLVMNKISDERIMDELNKMLRYDTLLSIKEMQRFPLLTEAMFSGRVSLDATMKQRGRG